MLNARPSSSFRRCKKFSVAFEPNWTKAKISTAGFKDSFALPITEVKLEATDLCRDEFHRKKQLAKVTMNKFLELGFVTSEELLEEMMDKHKLHPAKGVVICTMFNHSKEKK